MSLMLLAGKLIFLVLLYLFLMWAFRGLFERLAAGSSVPAPRRAVAPVVAPPPMAPAQPAPAAPPPVAVAPRAIQPYLVVENPGSAQLYAGQRLDLPAAITLGRAEDNGLVVDDKFCSQHHAMIFSHEGQRFLRDRKSTNGTYHNGQRITADALLRDGDRIAVGTVVLIYHTTPAL